MKIKNHWKMPKIKMDIGCVFPIAFLISIIFLCGLSYWIWIYLPDHPREPISTGGFPSEPVWVFNAPENVIATPLVKGNKVFVRTSDGIYALDVKSGKLLWRSWSIGSMGKDILFPSIIYSPLFVGNILIVPEFDLNIAAFDEETGNLLWRSNIIAEGIRHFNDSSFGAICVQGDQILVARKNHKLTSYRAKDGAIQWAVDVPWRTSLYLTSKPGKIYLGARIIYVYDALDGKLLKEKELDGLIGPILVEDGVLYAGLQLQDMTLIALDANSLQEIWRIKEKNIGDNNPRDFTSKGDILFLSGSRMTAISKSQGKILWVNEGNTFLERPVILNRNIYIRDHDSGVYSFDILSGDKKEILQIQSDSPMRQDPDRSPAVAGDLLIIPFGDNPVFAYRP
jgi:outer membrane protein assembly factor BamB